MNKKIDDSNTDFFGILIILFFTFFLFLFIATWQFSLYEFKKDCEYNGGYMFEEECYIYTKEFNDPNVTYKNEKYEEGYHYLDQSKFYYLFDSKRESIRKDNEAFEKYQIQKEKEEFEEKIKTEFEKHVETKIKDIVDTGNEILNPKN